MSKLDEYKKQYSQKSNSLEDYRNAYPTPAPYNEPVKVVEPTPIVQPKQSFLKRTALAIDSLTDRPDESTLTTNVNRNFRKYLPSQIIENTPFGVGEIIKQSRDNPEDFGNVKFTDVLQGLVDTSKGTFAGLIGTGASLAMVPLKFNVPILGEVTNLQYNAAQRIAQGDSVTKVIAEEGVINNIFGTLMLAGLAGEVAGARPTTINKVEIPTKDITNPNIASKVQVTKQPKSFRLYEEPVRTQPLSPDVVNKLGVDLGPKYNPELPTYFKTTGTAKGTTRFEVVQVKPSYLETFLKKFNMDLGKVPNDMVVPLVSREVNVKQLQTGKVSIVPESTVVPSVAQKPEIVNKVESIIPIIESTPPDKHLAETAKNLAQESGDKELVKKVEEAITKSEETTKQVEETNIKLQEYAEQTQRTPEMDLTEPISEPYKPARAVPADRVYSNTPTSMFAQGTFEGKPYTTDAFILEFNSDVKNPPKVELNGRGPAPDEASIRKIIPAEENLKPVEITKVTEGKNTKFVTLSGDGVDLNMLQKYYDYFNKKYPGATFKAESNTKPVVVYKGGQKVGLIMPLTSSFKPIDPTVTWQKAVPAQPKLSDTKVDKPKAKTNTPEKKQEVKQVEWKPGEEGYDKLRSEMNDPKDIELHKKAGLEEEGLEFVGTIRWNGTQDQWIKYSELKRIESFLENLSPQQAGIASRILNKEVKFKGKETTIGGMIQDLVEDGYKPQKIEVNKIKDLTRSKYNQMNNQEQEAFGKRQKEGGKTEEYFLQKEGEVSSIDLKNKTEFEYSKYLSEGNFFKKKPEIIIEEKAPRSSSAGDMSKGAGKIGNFEPIEPLKEGSKPFKLHNEILDMAHKYNPNGSIMESKNMPHGAAGVRWGDTGNISTQGLNDLAIMSHELSHTIDTENGITDSLMKVVGQGKNGNPIYDSETAPERKGLTEVYVNFYAGAKADHPLKTRMREGYATLLQKYVEMPQTITKQFPKLVEEFLQPGGKFYNANAASMVADSHRIASNYQNLSAIDKMGARVTDTLTETGKKSFMNPIETVNYEMTDNIAPYEKLDQNLADTTRLLGYTINLIQQNIKGSWKYGTKKQDNAYWGMRNGKPVKLQEYNWNSIINEVGKENQLKFGHWLLGRATYFDYVELGKIKSDYNDLKEAITIMEMNKQPIPSLVREKLVSLDKEYRELKQVIEKDGITEKEATDAYNEGKEIFSQPAEMFDALNKEKIKLMMDVGLLSKEQGAEYLSKEGYASRKRDIYNEIMGDSEVPTFIRVGNTKVSSMIRRRGSSKAVINPLVSAIHDDIEVTKKAAKQVVLNTIGELGLDAVYPDLIQRVTLKRNVDKETGAISYPQEKQEGVMMMRKDGQRIPFEVDKLISQVFNEITTPNNVGIIGRFAQFFGRTFTKGTTGIISTFLFKNPIIDSITSLAQTQTNYVPVYDQIKTFQKIISNKNSPEAQYAQEYMVFVGNSHTAMGIYDLTPEQQLQWINGEVNGLEAFGKAVEDKVNWLTVPTQMTEIGTRMMEYINARKSGKPFARSLEMAGQVSAPFHHKPRFGNNNGLKLWIGNLPYARSAIQVTTQAIKTMARDPKSRQRYLLVWGLVIAAYVAAQEGSMDDATEEQKALYEGLYGKQLARGIYFPDSDGKTLNVVPVSETMGWLAAMINMELSEMAGRTDYKVSDYAQAGSSFIPQQVNPFNGLAAMFSSSIPKPFDVGVGLLTNTKFYPAKLPIESQSLQRLPAGMRYNEKTSPVSKWAGKEFGISPVKMDYLVTGLLGRAGNMVLGKPSYWNFLSSFEQENYFTSSRLVQDFWETKKKSDENYNGYKKDPKQFTTEEKTEIVKTNTKLKSVYGMLNDYGDIDIEKYPDKAEKQRQSILKQLEKLDL
jgi:hypothetical protein